MADEESVTLKIFVDKKSETRFGFQNGRTSMLGARDEEALEEEARITMTIFVDTNLDTHFVFESTRDKTFGELKEVLKRYHELCYPDMGEVRVQNLLVEANLCWYVVVDSTLVGALFGSKSGFLKMNVVRQRGHGHETQTLEQVPNSNAENTALRNPTPEGAAQQIARLEAGGYGGNVNNHDLTNFLEVGGNGDVERDVLNVANSGLDGPVSFQVTGEPSISNVTNGFTADRAGDKMIRQLSENEKFEARMSFSDRMFGGTDFLTQGSLANTQDSVCSERQESGESGGEQKSPMQEHQSNALLQSGEDTAFKVEGVADVKRSMNSDDTIDLESKQKSMEETLVLEELPNLKETSGALPTHSVPQEIVYKCELPKEHAFCEDSRGEEKLSGKDSLIEKGGLLESDHLSLEVVTTKTHSDMGQRQSTPNRSTDMETDELIESLLSFQNENALLIEVDKVGTCSRSPAPRNERNAHKHMVSLGGGSSEQMQEFKTAGERSLLHKKKKKRKLSVEEFRRENGSLFEERNGRFQIVDDPGYPADVSYGMAENHKHLQLIDDKQKGKRSRHHHKRLSGVEVQEDLLKPEHEWSKRHSGLKSNPKGNYAINDAVDYPAENLLKSKMKGPNIGKTRLSKKRHSEDLSKAGLNAVSQDDVLPLEDNTSPTKDTSLTHQALNRKERSSEPSERANGEKKARVKLRRIRPKVQTPCPAGCGKIYSGKTSAFYQHRKQCRLM